MEIDGKQSELETVDEPTTWRMADSRRGIARPDKEHDADDPYTPEMQAIAEALTNPKGDPYDNARAMGFYCEQCG